jgi:hypothetical protein
MIVVVSDGRVREADRDPISDLGSRAGRAGIRIHSLAYVPASGSKGTLLNLGELSRKSLGTFRWVRLASAQAWGEQVKNLLDEIQRQYVLTAFIPAEDIAGRQLSVVTKVRDRDLVSNKAKVPPLRCGREECPADGYCVSGRCVERNDDTGMGVLGWLLALGGGLLGLGALGVVAAVVMGVLHRRKAAAPVAAPPPVAPPAPPHGVVQPIGHAPAAPPAPAVHAAPAPAAPHFYVMNGPRSGQRIPLHNGFTIGKAPGSHMLLDHDGFASSQHASITMDARGTCTLVDRGSTNGTFVNGIRVTQVVLTHGMAVRVGSTELRFLTQ